MIPVLLIALAAPGWELLAETDGVRVEVRDAGGGHTVVRGTKRVALPAARIVTVLRDLESFAAWIESLSTWKVLERDGASALVYARHDLPWPMDDRDYVVRYRWKTSPKGAFALEARSTTAGPKPVDGVVRLGQVRSLWTVTPVGSDAAIVTYKYHGDLGGDVPRSIERSAWAREPANLIAALERQVRKAP